MILYVLKTNNQTSRASDCQGNQRNYCSLTGPNHPMHGQTRPIPHSVTNWPDWWTQRKAIKLQNTNRSTMWPPKLFVCLLVFYVIATSKIMSRWVPICDSAHSWRLYSAASLGHQATGTMTCYPTQSHYLVNETYPNNDECHARKWQVSILNYLLWSD